MERLGPGSLYYAPAASGIEKIRNRWLEIDSMAGVGIDPDVNKIPSEIWDEVGGRSNLADGMLLFNQQVIDATAEYAVDFKVNSNFFQGELGRRALAGTFDYIKANHPKVLRVCDGKFADVGHTADKIAEEIFGELDADAVLLNPYMGLDAIEPFVKWKNKLVVLCINTSNPSAQEVQGLTLADGNPLWRHILRESMDSWNYNGNILPVLSATHKDNLLGVREVVGDTPILLAGIGTQGGSLEESVPICLDTNGYGLMISASRAILYPERCAGETLQDASRRSIQDLRMSINVARAA
ncbi:orotidine-5'-phosphate decarboxylase [Candidatus Saccharibacteria bacterium]|jgi:orotidine-5'-phosphate decarboxylase|nr:MAG: orotidine-5'-phosphate decarboxylase [Candidatus Saccharibacteria bacterium]